MPPILESSEHNLDPLAAFVATIVVVDGLLALFPTRDTRTYPFVFQRLSEPVSVISSVAKKQVNFRQAAE